MIRKAVLLFLAAAFGLGLMIACGAVSPATRATASIMPVTMPVVAPGMMTPKIMRQRLMPRARAASRCELVTRRIASSAVRATTGIMIIARATPAESAEYECMGLTSKA